MRSRTIARPLAIAARHPWEPQLLQISVTPMILAWPMSPSAESERITAALTTELWSADRGLVLTRDEPTGRQRPERTVGGLVPLVLPDLPPGVVDHLVGTLTGESFGAGTDGVHGVPSFDRTDPRYDPQRYWRGPTWLNTTWLVVQGLRRHGRHELAGVLADDMVALVAQSGFRQYFHPGTGTGHGTSSFSWSAALLVHVLAEGRG